MKSLLFLTPGLPYPPHCGARLKSLRLLDALAERYRVTLASPLSAEEEPYRAEFAKRSPCVAHLHPRIEADSDRMADGDGALNGIPEPTSPTHDCTLARGIRCLAAKADLIVIDHYQMADYVPAGFEGTVIYHAHNAYHQLWSRFGRTDLEPLALLGNQMRARRVRRAELAAAHRADLVFAAPQDAEFLIQAGVDEGKIEHTYHLGDDTQLELPPLRFGKDKERIMYVGNLGGGANTAGLLWFLEQVWPRLRAVRPGLEFDIAGKDADARVQALVARSPGARLLGFVEDLQPIYEGARVSVAPLFFGGGMQVKMLDAMARGLPTVTTTVGAQGIDGQDGQHFRVADDPQGAAEAVLDLLDNESLWRSMSVAARELVASRYTWRTLFAHMHRAIAVELRRAEESHNAAPAWNTPMLSYA